MVIVDYGFKLWSTSLNCIYSTNNTYLEHIVSLRTDILPSNCRNLKTFFDMYLYQPFALLSNISQVEVIFIKLSPLKSLRWSIAVFRYVSTHKHVLLLQKKIRTNSIFIFFYYQKLSKYRHQRSHTKF